MGNERGESPAVIIDIARLEAHQDVVALGRAIDKRAWCSRDPYFGRIRERGGIIPALGTDHVREGGRIRVGCRRDIARGRRDAENLLIHGGKLMPVLSQVDPHIVGIELVHGLEEHDAGRQVHEHDRPRRANEHVETLFRRLAGNDGFGVQFTRLHFHQQIQKRVDQPARLFHVGEFLHFALVVRRHFGGDEIELLQQHGSFKFVHGMPSA
jgi:hypothetical protein